MSFIRRIAIPFSALALGTAALGNLLLPYGPAFKTACGIAAALVAGLVLVRFVVDFPAVRAELENPAALAAFPAFLMACMLLATYLKQLFPQAATVLWVAALALQLGVVVTFIVRHVVRFDVKRVLPSWFLVFVGFVVASVTSPAFGAQSLGRYLLYAGLVGYAVMLPVVVYRLTRGGALPAAALPTLAIVAAPPSLCLVGYLAVSPAKQPLVVYILLSLAVVSLLFVLISLPRILTAPFSPAYAALTFPIVITAIAVKQSHAFLSGTPAGSPLSGAIVVAADTLAVAAVLYVFVRTAVHLAAPPRQADVAPSPVSA